MTTAEVCPHDGAKLLDLVLDDRDLLLGQTIDGRYLVRRCLAEGGMGKVYAAYEGAKGREVAIKVLKADYLRDETIRKRFMHEARIVANLEHPNVVSVFDFGQMPNGNFYMVMELLEGESLADRLAYKFLNYREILSFVPGICDALAEAHQRGVVHRDLKPENIFIVRDVVGNEQAKLIDFGVARQAERQTLTQTGSLWGTPAYMSPEQCRGDAITESADLYSMGIILYELVCGHLPFSATTQMGYAVRHMHDAARPMKSAPGLTSPPDELDALVLQTLNKLPEQRPASMRDFTERLSEIIDTYFQDEELLEQVPAQEVDPEALKEWMRQGDLSADERASESGPGRPISDSYRPNTAYATEAVAPAMQPGPLTTAPATNPRLMWGVAAVLAVLVFGGFVAVVLKKQRADEQLAAQAVAASAAASERAEAREAALQLSQGERQALEQVSEVQEDPMRDDEAFLEDEEQHIATSAMGQGATVAAQVVIRAELLTRPAGSALVDVSMATKKGVRSSKGSGKRTNSRGDSASSKQRETKQEVKDALRKTF